MIERSCNEKGNKKGNGALGGTIGLRLEARIILTPDAWRATRIGSLAALRLAMNEWAFGSSLRISRRLVLEERTQNLGSDRGDPVS